MMRVRDYLSYLCEMACGTRARSERAAALAREVLLRNHLDLSRPLRVLDLANGRLRPQIYLLTKGGHDVTGVDFVNTSRSTFVDFCYAGLRSLLRLQLGMNPLREPRLTRERAEELAQVALPLTEGLTADGARQRLVAVGRFLLGRR